MGLIRSSNQKPPSPSAPVDHEYSYDGCPDDDDLDQFWLWEPSELLREEDQLPEADGGWTYFEDEYEQMAWIRRVRQELDDRPAWEHATYEACRLCGDADDLDPLGTCWTCRLRDRRCQWCGTDRLTYTTEGACRTCYQRLRRTSVTTEERLRLGMMEAAFRRADLRKRRMRDA